MRFLATTTIVILLLVFGILFLLLFKGQTQLNKGGSIVSPKTAPHAIIASTTGQNPGGAGSNSIATSSTSSAGKSGFRGPTGAPFIIGPSSPPPKN